MSQRDFPRMALISPTIEEIAVVDSEEQAGEDMQDRYHEPQSLSLSGPNTEPITVPVITSQDAEAQNIDVKIWDQGDPDDDAIGVIDQGDDVAEWLTRFLESEKPLRLVHMDDSGKRYVSSRPCPK